MKRAGNNFPSFGVGTLHVQSTSYGTRSVPTTLGKSHIGKIFQACSQAGKPQPRKLRQEWHSTHRLVGAYFHHPGENVGGFSALDNLHRFVPLDVSSSEFKEWELEKVFSLGSYPLVVDFTGRLVREGKAAISAELLVYFSPASVVVAEAGAWAAS